MGTLRRRLQLGRGALSSRRNSQQSSMRKDSRYGKPTAFFRGCLLLPEGNKGASEGLNRRAFGFGYSAHLAEQQRDIPTVRVTARAAESVGYAFKRVADNRKTQTVRWLLAA